MKFRNTLILLLGVYYAFSKETKEDVVNENLPVFSLASGFYNEESIELAITAPDPNAIIYYTLDGSNPSENSTIYEKPFILKNKSLEENVHSNHVGITQNNNFTPSVKVNKGNIIRAMAKLPNGETSSIVSGSYFVGLNKKELYQDHPVISIITDPDNLFGYENGIYILGKAHDDAVNNGQPINPLFSYGNYSVKGKDGERPATIEYIPSGKNKADLTQDVGIRLKGRSTRSVYQKSFRVIARKDYGKKNIKYELIPGNMRSDGKGPVTKYKNFVLRNAGNDSEKAKMRDIVLQELIENDYFETQQNTYAIVFIDGEYWGIYDIYEDYDDNYIANNYDIEDKNVVVIKEGKVESGEDEDYAVYENLLKFIINNDMSVQANYEKVANEMDLVGLALYGAYHIYIDVQDGYFHGGNYGMWRARNPDPSVPKADGKYRMLNYDTDFSAGLSFMANNYTSDVFSDILDPVKANADIIFDGDTGTLKKDGPKIVHALLKNKEFKNMFVNYLCDVSNINFENKRLLNSIEKHEKILLPLIEEHILRNGPENDTADPIKAFKGYVNEFRTYMLNRNSVFIDMIQKDLNFEPAVKVTVTSNNFEKGGFIINSYNEFNESYTGKYFKENILYITSKPSKGNKVKSWTLNKCKMASKNSNTIGIYPNNNGCTITINYK